MKKILLAFDGTNFSEGAFEFARQLNEKTPVLITGVFIPQVDYANLWSYATAAGAGTVFVPLIEEEDASLVEKNMERFETLCKRNGISYRIHKDFFDFALPELKKETRFADVVIISSESLYRNLWEESKYEYIRDAIHASECPVLVVPEHYEFPRNNILAYDGSEESVYAIKQFAYIFPELAKDPTMLVFAEDDREKSLPSEKLVIELVTQHFEDLAIFKLEVDPKKDFNTWISERKQSLLVSGSYSRSAFSQMLKKSFVADIIREHRIPVFIAHK